MRATAVLRRASWNLVDQVISSGTNAALSFLIARSVSSADFGGFAVAFTVFSLVMGVSRAVSTSPLSVRFTSVPPEEFRRAAAAGVGTAFTLGIVSGLGCVVAGAVVGGAAGAALIALGVVLPGLLSQDAWRLVFFAEARPHAAALNDAAWAVTQLAAVGALLLLHIESIGPLVLVWGLSAAAAAVMGLRQSGVRPRPREARSWLSRHRGLTGYLLAEFVTVQGGQQAALLIIASVGSLEAIGALRGSQVLLGPATILAVGMYTFALPEFSRRRASLSVRGWMRGALALSLLVTLSAVAWGVLFLVLPDGVGGALLGDSWANTRSILVAAIVSQAGATIVIGPSTMLYAMDRARVTVQVHAVLAALILGCGVGGVYLGGADGAAWGFALAFWTVAPAWWLLLLREARGIVLERETRNDPTGSPSATLP
jgi:O-antigen/teichoic acid export membrane protein